MNVLISLGLSFLILIIIFFVCIRIFKKLRRGGSGATIATLGSLYDLQGKDGKRAIETIVEVNAGKKLEEQESSEGPD